MGSIIETFKRKQSAADSPNPAEWTSPLALDESTSRTKSSAPIGLSSSVSLREGEVNLTAELNMTSIGLGDPAKEIAATNIAELSQTFQAPREHYNALPPVLLRNGGTGSRKTSA